GENRECQDLVSLWSRPSSFLAVSKASSVAQRRPSTATRASIGVSAGQIKATLGHPLSAVQAGDWAGTRTHPTGQRLPTVPPQRSPERPTRVGPVLHRPQPAHI